MIKSFTLVLSYLSLFLFFLSCQADQKPDITKTVHQEGFELERDGPGKYAEYHRSIRTNSGKDFPDYEVGDIYREYQKAKENTLQKRSEDLDFVERGPANAGGRTRGILVDPDDPDALTWFAASVSGGIWKTEDGGDTWVKKTPDLANLATSTIAMSESNPNKFYVGTGEGFGNLDAVVGSGIWISEDKGETWSILESTANSFEFANVDRIIVDPEDDQQLLICSTNRTRSGNSSFIMKSVDGGASWTRTFASNSGRIQQLVASPTNFDTIYAAINSNGVFRSIDRGENWSQVFDTDPWSVRRLEMAISPSNPNKVYLSCESSSNFGSRLLFTRDAFETTEVALFTPRQPDWLVSQGWYDNTIAVHPYDDTKVWVAGQRPFLELQVTDQLDSLRTLNNVLLNASYLRTIENSAILDETAGLVQDISNLFGIDPEIEPFEDINRVRVTIGSNRSQMAHLMSVDLGTGSTNFERMIEVPMEVKEGSKQLAVSVFDIDGDGQWTLEDLSTQNTVLHDFIVTHNLPYTEEGDSILRNVNNIYKGQYYFAYRIDPDFDGDVNDLPTGRINFTILDEEGTKASFTPIADSRGTYADIKDVGSKGIHVDHHNIVFIPRDSATESFYVLNANDGGLAWSFDNGENWRQTGDTFDDGNSPPSDGYNVTQFYGIDKKNGEMQFVGGTQDNGSWVSPVDPEVDSRWFIAPSGDGFEAAWNYADGNQVLETAQFNRLYKSYDGGINWDRINTPGVGPFVTRVASSQLEADLVFMNAEVSGDSISGPSLIRSLDFGDTWEIIDMPSRFDYNNGGAPIKVSLVDPNVVWTGGIMQTATSQNNEQARSVCVSTDMGKTFSSTSIYTEATLGTITGLAVHPTNVNTAYALFSQSDTPKVLRTQDRGQSWQDISGFITNAEESENGFPDVATYCLIVMPWDTNQIWVGTDIGIVESLDGGGTWALANNGFPAVAIWDIRLVNDELVFATHGRGIWTLNVGDVLSSSEEVESIDELDLTVFPNPAVDEVYVRSNISTATKANIQLLGLDGRLMHNLGQSVNISKDELLRFELPDLVNGTYILNIQSGQKVISRKISVYQ